MHSSHLGEGWYFAVFKELKKDEIHLKPSNCWEIFTISPLFRIRFKDVLVGNIETQKRKKQQVPKQLLQPETWVSSLVAHSQHFSHMIQMQHKSMSKFCATNNPENFLFNWFIRLFEACKISQWHSNLTGQVESCKRLFGGDREALGSFAWLSEQLLQMQACTYTSLMTSLKANFP